MQYFEGDTSYNVIPAWVAAMLDLAYRWDLDERRGRRIGLLSTPCESEAAGLISLGALRRDLERASANHVDTHFDFLRRACRRKISDRSRPHGPESECSWDVRSITDDKRWYFTAYDERQDTINVESATHRSVVKRNGRRVPNPNGACNSYIFKGNATKWQLRDFPLPQLPVGGAALKRSVYEAIPNCSGLILEDNLSTSYDGLVLIGQGADPGSVYMRKFHEAGFEHAGHRYSLGDLLTLHRNGRNYIRRLRFISERSHRENEMHEARLVVADGVSALLHAERSFPYSDIIGICNRDSSVESIRQLKDWLDDAVRYYSDVDQDHQRLGGVTSGFLLRVLQRRG